MKIIQTLIKLAKTKNQIENLKKHKFNNEEKNTIKKITKNIDIDKITKNILSIIKEV